MSKASKTHTHARKPAQHGHAKSPVAARHVVSPGEKPRKPAKRARTPAAPVDKLPTFVLIAEEDYFESPNDELDDDDIEELGE